MVSPGQIEPGVERDVTSWTGMLEVSILAGCGVAHPANVKAASMAIERNKLFFMSKSS